MTNTSKNLDKDIENSLERLGLDMKESAVYCALLRLGTVGTSHLLEATGLHGQYVYQALAHLEERGLVAHAIVRGRKKFHANHPKVLVRVAEQQIRVAEDVVKQLQTLVSLPTESTFETYQGLEAFIAHEEELLRLASKGDELLVIGGSGDSFSESMGESYGAYEFARRKKDIRVRYIGSKDQVEQLQKNEANRFLFEARVLPGTFTGLVNTNIWPGVVNLNMFGTPVTSFVLKSPDVAASYRSFFEALWGMAK